MSALDSAWWFWQQITARLRGANEWLPPLGLRLILFWEFAESGMTKLECTRNPECSQWFGNVPPFGQGWKDHQLGFPFPFDTIAPQLSWQMATWFELAGAAALLIGLLTRFFSFALIILTVVATAAVHWPAEWSSLAELWKGYAITDDGYGNFKLPLLYFLMFLPLLFGGAGKVSLDNALTSILQRDSHAPAVGGLSSFGLALVAIGVPLLFLLLVPAIVLIALGLIALIADQFLG